MRVLPRRARGSVFCCPAVDTSSALVILQLGPETTLPLGWAVSGAGALLTVGGVAGRALFHVSAQAEEIATLKGRVASLETADRENLTFRARVEVELKYIREMLERIDRAVTREH